MKWLQRIVNGDRELRELREHVEMLEAERERLRLVYYSARELIRTLRDVNKQLDERNVSLERASGAQ